jgi:cyanophycin synthetase
MKIIDIKVMRGPNYWSNYRKKLIVMKLDLGASENFPTNKIDGFAEALETLMPSLRTHRCSLGVEGGFLERVRTGTWLGHVVEHIALELQSLAGMDCGFGRTRSTHEKGVYHVVFAYEIENAGIYAAKAAVRIAETLASDATYNLTEDLKILSEILQNERLGPSTLAIVKEAQKRDIPYTRLDNDSLIMLGYGCNQRIICATVACSTSSIAVDRVSDKQSTREFLHHSYVPMPNGVIIETEDQLQDAVDKIGYPIVIKPVDGNHGRGVTTRIHDFQKAKEAFKIASQLSNEIIVEKYISGSDYRFLVINYKLVAVAKRTPPMIMGDSSSTIEQLIEETNNDPARGMGHENILTKIKVDENTKSILVEKNLTLNTVLPIGEILFLKDTANLSSGGTAKDVTEIVHPHNVFLMERIARLMNLDICGIDVISNDIRKPLNELNGAVLEVNAGPGFRMHLSPTKGLARNVAEPVMNMLYPPGSKARIPIVAVTGTNGKTTTTRLISHIAREAGHTVGYTTSDGIYINENYIHYGDCSGPVSANVILRDPIVDFAVLECARGGILRSGLGFDKCNISIITNVKEDHLGLSDIFTLEEMATVKAVVARSTDRNGYSILNADDDLVYAIKDDLNCNVALFSINPNNSRINAHCDAGGIAAIAEDDYFVLCQGNWKTRIARISNTPLTLSGKAMCMVENILASILAATISGFDIKEITKSLQTFVPGPSTNPGRMNLFRFKNFRVMVDYAHNLAGLIEIKKYMSRVKANRKIGLIAIAGDRRDVDIREMGHCAAEIFDEVIIKHDKDNRGRQNDNISDLLLEGIKQSNRNINASIISDELTAVQETINNAPFGAFIFICADDIRGVLSLVMNAQELENNPKNSADMVSNS